MTKSIRISQVGLEPFQIVNPMLIIFNLLINTTIMSRVEQARLHFSHPYRIFGRIQITGTPVIDEYLLSCLLTFIFAIILYFVTSSLSYLVLFKFGHKKFTPKMQQLREYQQQKLFDIKWSIINIIVQTPLVTLIKVCYPYFSKAQYNWDDINYLFPIYVILHIVYDQFFTYWIHRILHHPSIYLKLHHIHHKSKSVTPFSGFAFHPIDAFLQAIPVFTSCFFIPLPLDLVLAHGIVTSLWAISIHDNVNMIPFKGILYAGSHSIHHFPWGQNYNYGKITSVCDRFYGSYCDPEGVSGYGYRTSKYFQGLMNKMNEIFQKIVPDNGKQQVQKQSRRLVKQKWDKLLNNSKGQ